MVLIFGKGGVHEVGTVGFTVSARVRRASIKDIGLEERHYKVCA
jgi:hypothetical protein